MTTGKISLGKVSFSLGSIVTEERNAQGISNINNPLISALPKTGSVEKG